MAISSVDEFVAGLSGWQAQAVAALRRDVLSAGGVTETLKWGHPVYEAGGPVCLIKAHKAHVTFGLWRGAEMTALEPRLEPGGSFQMAAIKLRAPGEISAEQVRRLVAEGIRLNAEKGDPLKAARA
jgi:hypothetical protein